MSDKMNSKLGKLSDIGKFIKPGSFVAFGGMWSANKPMAVVREIIRQKITGLEVTSLVGGWEMEWLLASGAVDHLMFSFLSLESFGLPPNFRNVCEKKLIKLTEIEGCSLVKGFEASAAKLPFTAFNGPKGSDIVKEAPDFYKSVTCPFTGQELMAVQAISPDVAVIHAQRADELGNIQIFGTSGSDMSFAKGAKKVIVTVEEIVSSDQLRTNRSATKLFRNEIDLVIHVPYGAAPCSCAPYYPAYLMQLMKDVQGLNPKTSKDYVTSMVGQNEEEYWHKIGGAAARKKLSLLVKKTQELETPPTVEAEPAEEFTTDEQMLTALAHTVDDGDNIVLGSFTPMGYCAYMLAKLTHAPNSFLIGYAGVDVSPFALGFHTCEASCTEYGRGLWTGDECVANIHCRGDGDVEAISSAQFDQNGNFNISWLPMPIRGDDGKPTGEWNPRGIRLPGGAGAPTVFGLHRKSIAYFPSHSKQTFVKKVNYITGTRFYHDDEERIEQGLRPGPMIVVTNLCVMQMVKRGEWKVLSLHKGVSAQDVIDNTGFPIEVPEDCPVTPSPTKQDVELIKSIDPSGIRHMDFMSGKERAKGLPAIIQAEWESV
jgi:glutaconate CoA-transferase subunit A